MLGVMSCSFTSLNSHRETNKYLQTQKPKNVVGYTIKVLDGISWTADMTATGHEDLKKTLLTMCSDAQTRCNLRWANYEPKLGMTAS
jgi:hypothetical protein